jgi:hypothetical protein
VPQVLDYEAFSARAKEIAGAIPAEYLEGVEEVVVHREAKSHPLIADVWTLGECEPSRLQSLAGEGPGRSIVHLYWGSFVEMAKDEGFDADGELRETIEHEIQHHIEDRAGVRALLDEDALFDAHSRFLSGLDAPPGWYRQGERLDRDVYGVELDVFVELRLRREEWERLRGGELATTILGEDFRGDVPADALPGEVLTYEGEGLVEETEDGRPGATGDLHLVPIVR